MVTKLGWKLFMTFATINILGGCTFAILIPETKNKSLEEMDVIFGAVTREKRNADISKAQFGVFTTLDPVYSKTHGLMVLRLCRNCRHCRRGRLWDRARRSWWRPRILKRLS